MAKNKNAETSTMKDKLAVIKKKVTRQRGRFIDHNGYTIALRKHAHPDEAGVDGTEHVNLGFDPKTYIGRRMSISVVSGRLRHPKLGKFSSMSHFAGWVTAVDRNDDMRNGRARRTSGEFPVNYVAMVAEALWHSVKNDKRLADELRRNELPFDCYRVFDNGERRRVNTFLIAIAEQITLALRQGVELDIEGFKADATVSLYHGTGISDVGIKRELPDLETAAARVFGKPKLDFQNGEAKSVKVPGHPLTGTGGATRSNRVSFSETVTVQRGVDGEPQHILFDRQEPTPLRGVNAVAQTVDELAYFEPTSPADTVTIVTGDIAQQTVDGRTYVEPEVACGHSDLIDHAPDTPVEALSQETEPVSQS